MYNIKLLNKISADGLSYLDPRCVVTDRDNPDGIILRSADMHGYDFNPELVGIVRAGAGYNNIPVDRCTELGIAVFNTPGANANAVRELVICALLLSSRKIPEAMEWCKTLAGNPDAVTIAEANKNSFVGPEILGKTLGIIGLGKVGVPVANAAVDLGMNVHGYDPYLSLDNVWSLSRRVKKAASYDEIYATSDYITLHANLYEETRGMINAATIAKMRKGVRIINLARGELVNNDDMRAALASGHVSKYVTDFPEGDIAGAEGVIAFPHLGSSTPESEENCASMAAQQLSEFLLHGNITNSLNFPNISEPCTTKYRITVYHRNIPNMISIVSGAIGNSNINIEHMFNRSRGDYSYMMIDTDTEISEGCIASLLEHEGILRIRVIK